MFQTVCPSILLSMLCSSSLAEPKGVLYLPRYLGNREASGLAIATVHSLSLWKFQDSPHKGHSRLAQAYRSAWDTTQFFTSIIRSTKLHVKRQVFVRPLLLPADSLAWLAAGSDVTYLPHGAESFLRS